MYRHIITLERKENRDIKVSTFPRYKDGCKKLVNGFEYSHSKEIRYSLFPFSEKKLLNERASKLVYIYYCNT